MRQISGWENVQAIKDYVELPAGGYVCKIMGAEVKQYQGQKGSFEKLEVSIDIVEGDFENYYTDNYRNQTEPKKWKGVLRYYVPNDDGTENDERSKKVLKAFTEAVEISNTGYHWDWNEAGLKGKKIGVLFRREEWEYDGRSGWRTAPFKAIDSLKITTGEFTIPKDKPLNKTATDVSVSSFEPVGNDEDLPF